MVARRLFGRLARLTLRAQGVPTLSLAVAVGVSVLMSPALFSAPPSARAALLHRPSVRPSASRSLRVPYPVQSLDAFSVAPDGTGGLAYIASVSGVDRVFVSRLAGGVLSQPVQVDAGLAGPSSQPVLAAGWRGELVVAFVNGGNLYVSDAVNAQHSLSRPSLLATQASNPAVSLNRLGQGYLAFTQAIGTGSDVKVDYWGGARWHPAGPEPLNVSPEDDAGTGSGRPAVIAAHDGIGLVTWGENGHVYARRVWGTMTSVQTFRLDPATYRETGSGGTSTTWSWQQAGGPVPAADGDSTYLDVAFQEQMSDGTNSADRVLVARIVAQSLTSVTAVDGLSTLDTGGGGDPQIVMNENGYGLVTDTASVDGTLVGAPLNLKGTVMRPLAITGADPIPPDASLAAEGGTATLAAWVRPANGDTTDPQVFYSYSRALGSFPSATQISSPAAGPVDCTLTTSTCALTGADEKGDGLIAWLQGSPGSEAIHLAGVLVPPGAPSVRRHAPITTHVRALLRWRSAAEHFGPVTYTVALNGRTIARTRWLSVHLGTRLRRGAYRWRVTATNQVGQTSRSPVGRLVVKLYHRPHRRHHRGHRSGRRHHRGHLAGRHHRRHLAGRHHRIRSR